MQLYDIIWLPIFLLIISVLVAAHEYGHYLFARIFKMGIEEFAIGFGRKPLWIIGRKRVGIKLTEEEVSAFQWRQEHGCDVQAKTMPFEGRGGIRPEEELVGDTLYEETVFTIRPWPVGGFVRIKGMVPEEDGSEVNIPGGFYSKPPWQRLLVLFAGPLFSVIAGVVLLAGLFGLAGVDRSNNTPVIQNLWVGKPADKAGLKPGDRIVAINGVPVNSYYEIVVKTRDSGGKPLGVDYQRDGRVHHTVVTPELEKSKSPVVGPDLGYTNELRRQYKLYVSMGKERVRIGFGEAIAEAFKAPLTAIVGVFNMFAQPSTFEDNVGGPATMMMVTRESVRQGPYYVIWLAAMLSISVGILNLLPWPPLDGGQMAVAFVEMLRRGRRLSMQVQGTVATIGFCLVALLTISVFVVDFRRLIPSSKGEKPPVIKTLEDPNPPAKRP